MRAITEIGAEYMELAAPHLGFDCDRTAPNYRFPPESFYRLLAHIALEDCYAANGSEMLRWLSDDDVDVPDSSTLHWYAQEFDVDKHAGRFLDAICALLERDGLLPPEPLYLAFDTIRSFVAGLITSMG